MSVFVFALRNGRETLEIYWVLARIMVPIAILAEFLSRMGVIEAIAPAFRPVMELVGLPPELGLVWLSGMLVGIWGAVPLIFTLVPVSSLSVADITILSALLLFAHGLLIEQKIIQKAGPAMILTTLLRIAGGLLYAFFLHHLFNATGWLSSPMKPAWNPIDTNTDWVSFFTGLLEMLVVMFFTLLLLSWGLEILKVTGILRLMMKLLAPVLRLAGIEREAEHFTAVGLFLGISYGAGLLIREARSGSVSPRQIFISCVFMGFAHSIVEDTLIFVALGADVSGILIGRLVFAVIASAGIAALLGTIREETFFKWAFNVPQPRESGPMARS